RLRHRWGDAGYRGRFVDGGERTLDARRERRGGPALVNRRRHGRGLPRPRAARETGRLPAPEGALDRRTRVWLVGWLPAQEQGGRVFARDKQRPDLYGHEPPHARSLGGSDPLRSFPDTLSHAWCRWMQTVHEIRVTLHWICSIPQKLALPTGCA